MIEVMDREDKKSVIGRICDVGFDGKLTGAGNFRLAKPIEVKKGDKIEIFADASGSVTEIRVIHQGGAAAA